MSKKYIYNNHIYICKNNFYVFRSFFAISFTTLSREVSCLLSLHSSGCGVSLYGFKKAGREKNRARR